MNNVKNPTMHASDGISLKEYVDRLFAEHQRAIDKAEAAMSTRLAAMNEFREQLKDQASRLLPRDEYALAHQQLVDGLSEVRSIAATHIMRPEWAEKCDAIEREMKRLRTDADIAKGKASQSAVLFAAAIALVGLIIGVVNLFKL